MMRTYAELITIPTYEERYKYLRLPGEVGIITFGFDRYINQAFYTSREWRNVRNYIITRDDANDMAFPERPIYGRPRIHHMNPVAVQDFENDNVEKLLDPENLVCVSLDTHNAIHYGTEKALKIPLVERRSGDSCLWVHI